MILSKHVAKSTQSFHFLSVDAPPKRFCPLVEYVLSAPEGGLGQNIEKFKPSFLVQYPLDDSKKMPVVDDGEVV